MAEIVPMRTPRQVRDAALAEGHNIEAAMAIVANHFPEITGDALAELAGTKLATKCEARHCLCRVAPSMVALHGFPPGCAAAKT
jgi:hypothetical protein